MASELRLSRVPRRLVVAGVQGAQSRVQCIFFPRTTQTALRHRATHGEPDLPRTARPRSNPPTPADETLDSKPSSSWRLGPRAHEHLPLGKARRIADPKADYCVPPARE